MKKAVQHLRSSDLRLAGIIEQVGPFRMQYSEPTFASLVRSIVYQQLSGRVAAVIHARVEAAAGRPVTPKRILAADEVDLRAAGLSKQKAAYIRDLAAKAPVIRFRELPDLPDEEVIIRLTQVKGIGVWTAHMFLIFALGRPNILPTADLGIRTAIKNIYELDSLPKPDEIERIGAPWRPYCSVASWYLWRSLELPKTSTVG